jgi:hypothetical protein
MQTDTVDYAKGETPMTDYQTKLLMSFVAESIRTSKDLDEARQRFANATNIGGILTEKSNLEEGMTDYQFKRYEELRDKCFALERKNEALYKTVKAGVEAGKSPEEILKSIEMI